MDHIDKVLAGIENLPLSPNPLPQLFKALTDTDSDRNQIVDLISFDPGLTAKLLQTCNSALLTRSEPVNDVGAAVDRLGFLAVYRVVAVVKGTQVLRPSKKSYGVNAAELWRHSVRAGFAAQFIAEDVGSDSGLFFTAGLLHDIGKVVLAEAFREGYGRVVSKAEQSGRPLVELEQGTFGLDHAAIGGRLLAYWKFSAELVASVGCHHHPRAALALERSAAYVQLASAVAYQPNFNEESEANAGLGLEEALGILGWKLSDLARYSDRLTENMAFVEGMARQGG